MKFNSYPATSCTTFTYGEVEDYTVVITGNPAAPQFSLASAGVTEATIAEEATDIKLYPNPAQDNVTVEITVRENANGTINIYNIMGEKVMTLMKPLREGENKIDINTSLISKGVYLLEMDANGEIMRQKFTIAK